jgi:WD40 repeat protein
VLGVAFHGNNQLLASCGLDRTVRLWNATNGQPLGALGAHAAAVNAVLVAANGATLYTAGDDGTLKFWRIPPVPQRLLAAHAEPITALALALDGRLVITGSSDKTVRISGFDNGQLVRALTGPSAAVAAVSLSVNGNTVAAGTADGRLFLWNANDGRLMAQTLAHGSAVTGVALHPQGTQTITVCGDGMLKVWQVMPAKKGDAKAQPELKAQKMFQAHTGGVTSVAFHQNGAQVLTGGADKTARLWNSANGQLVRTLGPFADPVNAVAFSRDHSQIGTAAGKVVKVYNVVGGKEVLTLDHPATVTSVSFSADKARIATASADGLVRAWDVATGKELQFFSQAGPVRTAVFHPNNTAIISAGTDKAAAVQTIAATRVVAASPAPVRALAQTPGGGHVLTSGDDKTIKLWNIGNGISERTLVGPEQAVQALAVSRNGVLLAAAGADRRVRVYTLADSRQQGVFKTGGGVRSLAFSPNAQVLAAACEDNALMTWNVGYGPAQPVPADFGKPGQSFVHGGAVTAVAFQADSKGLYTASLDKTIKAWKLASDQPVHNLGHGNLVDAVAFNPASTQLATGSHDGTVRIWDVTKGQQLRQINAHTTPAPSPVYCLAWSPDGKQVISGSLDRTLKLWDATSGNLVREFKAYKEKDFEKGHRDGVFCVAWSPDGKSVASGSSDHMIKIWRVADGAVVRDLVNPGLKSDALTPPHAHPGWVYSLRFVDDGRLLVSVGTAARNHGYLAVWSIADGKLLHGQELALGAFHAVAVSPDSRFLAVACGPRGPQFPDVDCYIFRMPETDKRQASQAGR